MEPFRPSTFHEFMQTVQAHEPLNVDELWSVGTFLKFALLELILKEAWDVLHSPGKVSVPLLLAHIKSLQSISNADWVFLIEPLIGFDEFLRQDPARIFKEMDFETRELYRKRIAIVARRSDCSESQVAQAALELAREGDKAESTDPRMHLRRAHVGYYLIGNGFSQLASRVGFHPCIAWRARAFVRDNGEDFFLTGIQLLTLLFIAAVLFPVLPAVSGLLGLASIILFLLFPATQDAVDLVNTAITAFFDPEALPKLDLGKGVPPDFATLVAVPSLLIDEKQVRKLVNDLEVRFLANRDRNLHFALLTDLPDSVSNPHERDSHPLVDLASRLITELNEKYQSPAQRSLSPVASSPNLQHAAGRMDGLGTQARQAPRSEQAPGGRIRCIPYQDWSDRGASRRSLRAHARQRHATSSRRRGAPDWRHCPPSQSSRRRSHAPHRHFWLWNPAAPHRDFRSSRQCAHASLRSTRAKVVSIFIPAPFPTHIRISLARAFSPAKESTRSRLCTKCLTGDFPAIPFSATT